MTYPTPKQLNDAARFAQRCKDRGLDLSWEITLATRHLNKFKSERIRAGVQAEIDALTALC